MSTDGPRVEVHPGRYAVVDFDPQLTFEGSEECTWCCHHGVLRYERDLSELAARTSPGEPVSIETSRDV